MRVSVRVRVSVRLWAGVRVRVWAAVRASVWTWNETPSASTMVTHACLRAAPVLALTMR